MLCMIEYVRASKRWAEQLYNGHCHKFNRAGGDHVSAWNWVYNADKFNLFDINGQNKPASSECNSSIGIFSHLGIHNRYSY